MDHRKQKQMINQMLDNNAKSEEELSKMSPEEKKAYLQSRLQQKMFFSTAQRRSNFQKQQLQEKFQEKLQENTTNNDAATSAKTDRNRRKRQKKREKLRSQKNDENIEDKDDDVVVVNNPDESTESDYHSD